MGKKANKKKAALSKTSFSDKRAVIAESFRTDSLSLYSFRIAETRASEPFSWHSCDCVSFVFEKLKTLQGKTHTELGVGRSHFLEEKRRKLSKEAEKAIEDRGEQFESGALYSLRLDGTTRIIGLLIDGVFDVIWWDPHHQFHPSHKKHT